MQEIDVEKIMEDIRDHLPETEEAWQALRFEDISVDSSAAAEETLSYAFDAHDFNRNAARAGAVCHVPFYREIPGGRLIVFIKRVVRKLIRFCVEPIAQDITVFQTSASACLNGLRRFLHEQFLADHRRDDEIAALHRRVEELENRLAELERK